MILGTYRADALSDAPALSHLLLQLHAHRHAYDLDLTPLPFHEHKCLVNSILGQVVSEEFIQFLYTWDEGNPLFTEELLGSMVATGQLHWKQNAWHISTSTRPHLPLSLAAAILERLAKLPADDQEVLANAAVIGRTFDFSLLATLSGMDERELVSVLRRAVSMQLISEASNTQLSTSTKMNQERYQFHHALIREAIYDPMLAPERRLRHRTVAETLERMVRTPPANTTNSTKWVEDVARLLAEHYWQAGLPEEARPYALHEAECASRVFAFREERYYLNMVQASLSEDSPERIDLLQRMGMLSLGIYDLTDALHWLTLAKASYQRIGHQSQALQVMANLLFANWFLANGFVPALLAEIENAAEVVFAHLDPASRNVGTLTAAALIAHYYTVHSQYSRSVRWLRRCFALYEALDDPRKVPAIQLCYITRGWYKGHHTHNFEESIDEILHAINVAGQYSLPEVIMIGHTTLAYMLINWGRIVEAEQVLAQAAEHEERSGTLLPSFLLGWQCFFSGNQWERGIQRLQRDIERLDRLHVFYLAASARVVLAHLLLARNELAEAEMHLQAAQPALEANNEYNYLTLLWWGLAKLCTSRGNLLQAQKEYERIMNRWKSTEDVLLILPIWLDGIVLFADTGNRVKARQWLAEFERVMQQTDNPIGVAALLEAQGTVHVTEGKMEQAIQELRQAVEAWDKLKRGYQHAQASQRLARVLLRWANRGALKRVVKQAAREQAELLLNKAVAVYERLEIPSGVEAVQAMRVSTRLDAQQKRRHTLETRQPEQGLTQREIQVFIHLAAGKTNKEIATVLSLSIGTVGLHVSHILTKLGCENRTQAAAYAIAKGWVKHQEPM